MHEYPIEGVQNGTLRAEKDGLYWKIDASCTRDWDHPIRLLAETDGVRVSLGVPQPEGEKLRLRPVRLAVLLHDLQDGEVRDVVKWLFRLKGQQCLLRLLIGADAGAV